MDQDLESTTNIEELAANAIRVLGMDAVQKANSGHPGMVMGMADIVTVLYHDFLQYDSQDPHWCNRDRVVLSNGHGSMLLYSILHLTGISLTIEDLKNFRQWNSPTAGHPEYGYAYGIETTTGPLGQGIANGIGMAIAESHMRAKFGKELIDHYTYILCGDGCLMEGVSAEASSLAGHLGLGKIILFYDDNSITIDGGTDLAFTENVSQRYESYGWQVLEVDGHDRQAIREAIREAQKCTEKPSMLRCKTVIAKGSPNKAGSSDSHGSPLGEEEIQKTKAIYNWPYPAFEIPDEVYEYFREDDQRRTQIRESWLETLSEHPQGEAFSMQLQSLQTSTLQFPNFEIGSKIATRAVSGQVIQSLSSQIPALIGGSADLAKSNKTYVKGGGDFQNNSYNARNLHFGVREHGMASICNGIALYGGLIPYCATFLCFHDYMRPAVRLSSLMHQQIVYVYTHDSFYLGEDGPTHQPVEHVMSMRMIPNFTVIRPADANETKWAWRMALENTKGPTGICLTRQGLPTLEGSVEYEKVSKGGYIVSPCPEGLPEQIVLIATGSEVSLAVSAQQDLRAEGIGARVVSLLSWEVFDQQSEEYCTEVLGTGIPRISIEAGRTMGWEKYVASAPKYAMLGLDHFGASAPASELATHFGFTSENLCQIAKSLL